MSLRASSKVLPNRDVRKWCLCAIACILTRYTGYSSKPCYVLGISRGLARMTSDHVSDEWLDKYSRGTLEAAHLGQVEEHLLICEQCCERLTKLDDAWGLNG